MAWGELSRPLGGAEPPASRLPPSAGVWCALGGMAGMAAAAAISKLRVRSAGGPVGAERPPVPATHEPVGGPGPTGRRPAWLRALMFAVLAATLAGLWWGWAHPGNWALVLGGICVLQGATFWGLYLGTSAEAYRRHYGDRAGQQREFERRGWIAIAFGAGWIGYELYRSSAR